MLIERDDALQSFDLMRKRLDQGFGGLVLVGGEAGIGKTALISACFEQYKQAYQWVWGGCDALFTPRALGPIYDIASILECDVDYLLSLENGRAKLFSALLSALQKSQKPIVLVFEDFHWADHASLDLLKFLGRRINFIKVLLVVTFRDDEMGVNHPLRLVLGELPHNLCQRIKLEPISAKSVTNMAISQGYLGSDIFEITGGNPFFVTELLAAKYADNAKVPASIKDAISSRLNHLNSEQREFLELFSTMPGVSQETLLQHLFTEQVHEHIKAATRGGILTQDANGGIKFRHELGRLATLERLSASSRRKCHEQILTKLLALQTQAPVDQIVHHSAGALDGDTVLHYAPIAAAIAAKAGAHREAALHLATALRFIDQADTELAASLYERWATEAALSSRTDDEVIDARRHAIALWKALNRVDKIGENLRLLSRLYWYRGEALEADRASEQAIKVLESIPPSAQQAMAYSLRSQLCMLNDQMDQAVLWGNRALALELRFTDVKVRIHALNNVGTALIFRNNIDGLAMLQEGLKLAKEHDEHEEAARAYVNLSEYALEFRHFELAEKMINEGIVYDIEHDIEAYTYYMQGRLAQLRLEQGRLEDACTIAQSIFDNTKHTLLTRLPALQVLARAHMRLNTEEAPKFMQAALEDALATEELQHIVPARLTLIEAAWLSANYPEGQIHLDILLTLEDKDRHPWNIGERCIWQQRYAQVHGGKGLEIVNDATLPIPFVLEMSGDYIGAAKHWQKLGLPHAAALSLLAANEQSYMLECASILTSISAQAGLKCIALIAKQKNWDITNVSIRGRYNTKASQHPLGLTKKEQQVLVLLAKGENNKEISSKLSRSPRTVEHHVTSILTKLNAPNRMAVLLRVQDEPWLLPEEVGAIKG